MVVVVGKSGGDGGGGEDVELMEPEMEVLWKVLLQVTDVIEGCWEWWCWRLVLLKMNWSGCVVVC